MVRMVSCTAGGQTMGPHTMGRYRTNAKTHDLSCTTPAAHLYGYRTTGDVKMFDKAWAFNENSVK